MYEYVHHPFQDVTGGKGTVSRIQGIFCKVRVSHCLYQRIITHRQYKGTLRKVDSTLYGQSIGEGQPP
jgi:hypothetical protein